MTDPTILNGRALLELSDAEYEQNEAPRCSRDWHPGLKLGVIVVSVLAIWIVVHVAIRLGMEVFA